MDELVVKEVHDAAEDAVRVYLRASGGLDDPETTDSVSVQVMPDGRGLMVVVSSGRPIDPDARGVIGLMIDASLPESVRYDPGVSVTFVSTGLSFAAGHQY